jgi:hypothetical protein
MMTRDTYSRSSLNLLKIDLLSSLKLSKDIITKDSELEISRVCLKLLKLNKLREEIFERK